MRGSAVRRGVVRGAGPNLRARDVAVPMRDGVAPLGQRLLRPEAPGRYPTILVRTPYSKGSAASPNCAPFVARGYAVVGPGCARALPTS